MNETSVVALVLGICLALFIGLMVAVFYVAVVIGRKYDAIMKKSAGDDYE